MIRTYSHYLDPPATIKIIATVTLQNASEKGSALFELKGLQEYLQDLSSVSYTVIIATGRNKQVAKRIREKHLEIEHDFES